MRTIGHEPSFACLTEIRPKRPLKLKTADDVESPISKNQHGYPTRKGGCGRMSKSDAGKT
jgi:hypothetical protein